jgi:hypothetical protein
VLPEDAAFTVTASQLADIAQQVPLSKEVQEFLSARVME